MRDILLYETKKNHENTATQFYHYNLICNGFNEIFYKVSSPQSDIRNCMYLIRRVIVI
jgi:hypothetical protein